MDDEIRQTWTMDPDARRALRLDRARRFLDQGSAVEAIVECEELLDEDPDHLDALFLLADALLATGDAEGAIPVFERYLAQQPDDPGALAGLAVARFDHCDLPGAVVAAREAIRLAPDDAEAHHTLGLALELMPGHAEDAERALATARTLSPETYPPPLDLTPDAWEEALRSSMSLLPKPLQRFWRRVPVHFEHLPSLDELRRSDPPITPGVPALYEGEPPEEGDPWRIRPRAVRIYRGNLARCRSLSELVERLAMALQEEAVDWLGPAAEDAG